MTIVALFAVLFLAACANTPPLPDIKTVEETALGFLVEGKTTREEVLLELGPAYRAYENERILTYSLGYDEKNGLVAASPRMFRALEFYLVLVFDAEGILKRHKVKSSG